MAQPQEYTRKANFSDVQALAPTDPLPGNSVDAELNAIKTTLDEIRANLARIQRDDGQLGNATVGQDQLKAEFEIGFNPPTNWATATDYYVKDNVLQGGVIYKVLEDHTSGDFATDLAAQKLEFQFDFGADATAAGASAAAALASELDAEAAQLAAEVAQAAAEVAKDIAEATAPATAIDGGRADSNYTSTDPFDGGGASDG